MPLVQDCPAPIIDSPTGHYNNTVTYSSSLWLIFLASIQQGRALERVCKVLNNTSTYTLPCLLKIYQKPPKQGHLFTQNILDGTNGVRITEVPLYRGLQDAPINVVYTSVPHAVFIWYIMCLLAAELSGFIAHGDKYCVQAWNEDAVHCVLLN